VGIAVLHGSGRQSRDFIYIDDVVEAIVQAALVKSLDGAW